MYSRLIGHQTRLARTLALAALLLLTAVQALEVGHSHAAQDTADHCLLCKNPAGSVLVVSSASDAPAFSHAAPAIDHPRPVLQFATAHPLARGPPFYA